ncbi:MAG: glycosyltransferase family 39 protein [Spirochaetes bacterium]|nr:glycosyltransferase family 39 protein [Spirochaetota bacterium]
MQIKNLNKFVKYCIPLLFLIIINVINIFILNFSFNKITVKTDSGSLEYFDKDGSFYFEENKLVIDCAYDLLNFANNKKNIFEINDLFFLENIDNNDKNIWKSVDFVYKTRKSDRYVCINVKYDSLVEIDDMALYLDNEPVEFSHRDGIDYYFVLNPESIKYFSEMKIDFNYKKKSASFDEVPINSVKIVPDFTEVKGVVFSAYIDETNINLFLKKIDGKNVENLFDQVKIKGNEIKFTSKFDAKEFKNKIDYKFKFIIFIISILFALYIFFLYDSIKAFFIDKKIIKSIIEESDEETKKIIEKKTALITANPRKYRIPIVGKIFAYINSDFAGFFSIIILVAIFIGVKAPYMNLSFAGGSVTAKYNSYVEPAKYMAEKNNPLWYQAKYSTNPINNPDGVRNAFGSIPILEWALYLCFEIFKFNSIELNVRIVTALVGVLIIIFSFLVIRRYFPLKMTVIVVLFMVFNQVIHISTFMTVYDSLIILFFLISLYNLLKYYQYGKFLHLYLASIFLGIGFAIKISLAIYSLPIIAILTLYNNKNAVSRLKIFFIIIAFSFSVVLAQRYSIFYLIQNTGLSLFLLITYIAVYILLYFILKLNYNRFDGSLSNKLGNKYFIVGFTALLAGLTVLLIYLRGYYKLFPLFITDMKLLFNFDFYKYLLLRRYANYSSEIIFIVGACGIVFSLLFYKSRIFELISAFFVGSAIYTVIASKSIYIHHYYTIIIMIAIFLSAALPIYYIFRKLGSKASSYIFMAVVMVFLIRANYQYTVHLLSYQYEGAKAASEYLGNNMSADEYYIPLGNAYFPTLYTSIPAIYDYSRFLSSKEVRDMAAKDGLKCAMDFYKVKYVVSVLDSIDYYIFANALSEDDLMPSWPRRTDEILAKIDKNYDYYTDKDKREKTLKQFDIKRKVVLEKKIGDVRIYKFIN